MKIYKPKFWRNNFNIISILLIPLALLVELINFLKKIFVKQKKFDIPVICIGNIYLGGTGKTPLSFEVVKIIESLKYKTALVKKFYKKQMDEIILSEGKVDNILTDTSRVKAIKQAIDSGIQAVVLDDGFQDHSVYKDLNIICFNANQLIGNGRVIPAGPLRENLSNLKKSQIVVINGKKNILFEKKINQISKKINIYYSEYTPKNIKKFHNKNILAFAGIGNPENFFDLLKRYKLNVKKTIHFPDHHNYTKKELLKIKEIAKKNKLEIITTEKDYCRIENFKIKNFNKLPVKLKIKQKKKFIKNIRKHLR